MKLNYKPVRHQIWSEMVQYVKPCVGGQFDLDSQIGAEYEIDWLVMDRVWLTSWSLIWDNIHDIFEYSPKLHHIHEDHGNAT